MWASGLVVLTVGSFMFLLRLFFRLRALEARCRICTLVWAGAAEKGLRVGLVVGGDLKLVHVW